MKEEETIVLETFLEHVNKGRPVRADSPMQQYMTKMAFEAMKITFELNSSFHTPEEIRKLFFQLTGQPEEETFRMFPPFTTDCGKNIRVGKNVFINSGCRFQDQGGITLGDETLVGHNVVFATLNHGVAPEDRGDDLSKTDPYRQKGVDWSQCDDSAGSDDRRSCHCGSRRSRDKRRSCECDRRRRAGKSDWHCWRRR